MSTTSFMTLNSPNRLLLCLLEITCLEPECDVRDQSLLNGLCVGVDKQECPVHPKRGVWFLAECLAKHTLKHAAQTGREMIAIVNVDRSDIRACDSRVEA